MWYRYKQNLLLYPMIAYHGLMLKERILNVAGTNTNPVSDH
ncbi:hypothetical protein NECAME_19063 [Necator americanus]|uniref:Uncharacterized protein n=1 Tax=Necator americanus TaxID=51031 RepID=W2SSY2_NECAM|nr:hypothetical protein NECAME_19082 [Necator americanus]XP_013294226.1 hypothetical protein NECAME_19063 [Necator americanus]ETN71961.1 hypothetical protein NECAME_19082 [Necator americanus]ETN71999.1 hypothetical protein NECAME_19063 [Necator americanus]